MKDTVSSGAVICQYDFAYDPYVVLLIGGLVGIIRPKLLLEFIQDENKKGKMNIDPLFSEKIYKVLEFCGGLVLIIIALGHLVFNLNI